MMLDGMNGNDFFRVSSHYSNGWHLLCDDFPGIICVGPYKIHPISPKILLIFYFANYYFFLF